MTPRKSRTACLVADAVVVLYRLISLSKRAALEALSGQPNRVEFPPAIPFVRSEYRTRHADFHSASPRQ